MVQITWSVTKSPRVAEQCDVNIQSINQPRPCTVLCMPAGWRSWFVAGLLYPRLRARTRSKPVDFPDAENRQRSYRMIIRHEKDPLSVRLAWMLSTKLNS
ncbi:hypothetical protein TNCV_4696721 [Trichonephila clavipes]|nr:hypothetical protein TNCV_4696721 [Trichonephila clavipes]